jgi:casein kinase 1
MGPPKPPSKVKDGEFEVVKRLGAGCFGEVWLGKNTKNDSDVAMKFEFRETKSAPQLFREAEVIKTLREGDVKPQGVVESMHYGQEGSFNCLVMEILGKSLEDHVQKEGGKLNAQTTGLIAEQVLQRIEYFHSKRLVHRDIKPENFMFGIRGKVHHVYIIDFGLSKLYWDSAKNSHAEHKTGLSLTGTARYASINAHKGLEQSRRDDLEAIGHMFLYFLRGVLPWSGLDAKTQEEKYRLICHKKENTPLDDLCKGFPDGFKEYLAYTRALNFTQRPDYTKLHEMISGVRSERTEDHDYQWFVNNPSSEVVKRQKEGSYIKVQPRTPLRQPDDAAAPKEKKAAAPQAKEGSTQNNSSKAEERGDAGGQQKCCIIS